MGYSVTQRMKMIKQPIGGYIKPTDFKVIEMYDGNELNVEENIFAGTIGLTVDYMTRFLMGASVEDAFNISLIGAKIIQDDKNAQKLLEQVKGLDDNSIKCACKLCGYDVCYRVGPGGYSKPVEEINPDKETIQNISIMLKRSKIFWEQYGPIVKDGFTFEGGYTSTVSAGDADYLTKDTLWDFKVSKNEPQSKHTLQLVMYYLMGKHSVHKEFRNIENLGIFNPRKNKVYLLNTKNIPRNVIDIVSYDIIEYATDHIGYGMTEQEIKDSLEMYDESYVEKMIAKYYKD